MVLSGIHFHQYRGDDKKYGIPLLSENTVIDILYDDTSHPCCGQRLFKRGKYKIIAVEDSFNQNIKPAKVYKTICNRKNASYIWYYNTVVIDKAICAGVICVSK